MRPSIYGIALAMSCCHVMAQPTILFNSSEVTVSNGLADTGLTVDGATIYSGEVTITLVNPIANSVVVNIELDNSATVKEAIGQLKIKTVGAGPEFVSLGIFTKAGYPFSPLVGEVIRTGGSHGVNLTIRRIQQVGLPSQGWTTVQCERINEIFTEAGTLYNGDVLANVTGTGGGGTHAVSATGYVGALFIAGDLLGDITVSTPGATGNAAGRLVIEGQVGTAANPVQLDLAGNLDELWGNDIYADIDLSTSTGVGDIGYLNCGGLGGNGNFTGSIKAGSVIGGTSGDQFAILGDFDGTIELSGSLRNLTTSTHWIGDFLSDSLFKIGNIPADAVLRILGGGMLDGQIIVNQGLNGTFDWDGDVQLPGGIFIGPGFSQPYKAPYYEAMPSTLGGGAIGLAPFNFHPKASVPEQSGSVTLTTTSEQENYEAVIEHYGPVFADSSPAVLIERRIDMSSGWADVTSQFTVTVADSSDPRSREVRIKPSTGNAWVTAQYRVSPDELRCADVAGTPSVVYLSGCDISCFIDHYGFAVNTSSACQGSADVNGDGFVTPADFSAWVAAFNAMGPGCDQNGDSACTPADFSAWVSNYNNGCL